MYKHIYLFIILHQQLNVRITECCAFKEKHLTSWSKNTQAPEQDNHQNPHIAQNNNRFPFIH